MLSGKQKLLISFGIILAISCSGVKKVEFRPQINWWYIDPSQKMVLDRDNIRPLDDARNNFMTCIAEDNYGKLMEYILYLEHRASRN
jgi:hypothetical protein